ncbi:MAG: DNA polymerase/3'-5' exonuclease PolX [Candidatus Woesearchaeota archaeon]
MNKKIVKLFNRVSDALEIKGVQWKPRAYRKAARVIDSLDEDVKDIYEDQGIKGLSDIPGVGKSIAKHIEEYIKKGEVQQFRKHLKGFSNGQSELLDLEGMGPKKAKQLKDKLGVIDIDDLKKAIDENKIRKLEGFGKKSEESFKRSIEIHEKSRKRTLLGDAYPAAISLVKELKDNSPVGKIEYAGSLRRMKETVGDIDILVTSKKPKDVMDYFVSMNSMKRVLAKGNTKSSVILDFGIQIDLRVVEEDNFGAALQYFTGSKDHNVALRKEAISQGYKLSEYGLFKKNSGKKIRCRTEKELYNKLGFSFIPPELREGRDELELAKTDKIPKIIELKDIKGDLQMHTKYSDGQESIKKMAEAAEEKGYEYIAITDHSVSERIANGMDEHELGKQMKEIDRLSDNFKITILKSAEVNILDDGSLDYPDNVLKKLDLVVASLHSRKKISKKKLTEKILNAIKNKHVSVLAHPTGRLIHKREPMEFDLEAVSKEARNNNVALEINSDPRRLDLEVSKIRALKETGVKFSINTDSHISGSLDNMKFGVGQARRAGLSKADIINTWSLSKLKKWSKH